MNQRDIIQYLKNKIQKHTDWFMTAEEAIFYGFADIVLNTKGIKDIYELRRPDKKKRK